MADLAIGIIGAGGMGTRHAQNLHTVVRGAQVAGIYDLDQERAGQVAAQCGNAQVFGDPAALIRDSRVEAVVIVSPDPTHAEFVHECLRNHKPVLCEKPLATTTSDADSIIRAEQELGRRLVSVGFMRRFDPQHVAVKQAVTSGEIGRPVLFKGVHRNVSIAPNLPASTVVTNSAIHDLDSARWLLGQEISEVFVRGVKTRETFGPETLDLLLFQLVMSDNALATIETTVAAEYGYEVLAEIVGQRGTVQTVSPANAVVRANKFLGSPVSQSHLDRFQEAFVPELVDWVRSVHTGQQFSGASAWDGYMATLVAEACIQSLQTGQPVPVETLERPDFYAPREAK